MDGDLLPSATPIDPDEADSLIPDHITTRGELDELEEVNIQEGLSWAFGRAVLTRNPVDVLTEAFLYDLHRRMFDAVWTWAGKVRLTNKNIGIDKHLVRTEVRKLVDDARYWLDEEVYPAAELAIRYHHRLVSIHPFPNGNGRHARLMADLIVQQLGLDPFSWGGTSLNHAPALRSAYIEALWAADGGDLDKLMEFAYS